MKLTTYCLTLALAITPPWAVAAELTPAQVFRAASPSVVTVFVVDPSGADLTQGSGVVFAPGRVVTNCHLNKHQGTFKIEYKDRRHSATLSKPDSDRDLCILEAPTLSAPAATLGVSSEVEIGAPVYAIGAPQGFDLTLSDGLLSGRRGKGDDQILQTTAPISVGSSGGGLFDANGRLIGITTLIYKEAQQINFAVPVEWLVQLDGTPAAELEDQAAVDAAQAAADEAAAIADAREPNSALYRYTLNGQPRYSKAPLPPGAKNITRVTNSRAPDAGGKIPSSSTAATPMPAQSTSSGGGKIAGTVYSYQLNGVRRYSSVPPPSGATDIRNIRYQYVANTWMEAYRDQRVTVSFKYVSGDQQHGLIGWERYQRAAPMAIKGSAEKVSYTLARKMYYCNARTSATAEVVYYAADGRVISSHASTLFSPAESVVPDSVGEAVLDSVCG